ncbi:uncharacterized protein SPPG_09023 [Spizellomyces punctatus DAOM BR117]|uniref:Uncharacterized protein n=1 Tax=Spizellomyces punctatus (strain DAOM BR117) TaxID=645134 RepID=A0A0L0HLI3_SPIPD|nr:uncharacterized protein SPPG_09023 [Spizellomyces punctatus DAOM BR117]KND01918.1 hypothetical protein SPPG_09023 [Spizellomyces punctatus DAOM BR117]|eukprot:XP_016609957.1 hypothetical protein SPPG_09023 [Spizellomyces punctatus DAOM BR117]
MVIMPDDDELSTILMMPDDDEVQKEVFAGTLFKERLGIFLGVRKRGWRPENNNKVDCECHSCMKCPHCGHEDKVPVKCFAKLNRYSYMLFFMYSGFCQRQRMSLWGPVRET